MSDTKSDLQHGSGICFLTKSISSRQNLLLNWESQTSLNPLPTARTGVGVRRRSKGTSVRRERTLSAFTQFLNSVSKQDLV